MLLLWIALKQSTISYINYITFLIAFSSLTCRLDDVMLKCIMTSYFHSVSWRHNHLCLSPCRIPTCRPVRRTQWSRIRMERSPWSTDPPKRVSMSSTSKTTTELWKVRQQKDKICDNSNIQWWQLPDYNIKRKSKKVCQQS